MAVVYFLSGYPNMPPLGALQPCLWELYPNERIVWRDALAVWSRTGRTVVGVEDPGATLLADWRFPQVPGSSPTVSDYRAAVIAAIDRRTQDRINSGFTFSGRQFSLSTQAQQNWMVMFLTRTDQTYPLDVSAADHGSFRLANASAVASFFTAARAAIKGHLDAGRDAKVAALAAVTMNDLDAIAL